MTEWEELQIKHGNLRERPKPVTEAQLNAMAIEFAEQQDPLAKKSLNELNKLEDDIDEDELERYRRGRLEELRRKRAAYKFGQITHVGKDQYIEEVTKGSANGQWVVCLLYSEAKPMSKLLLRAFEDVARRHGEVKFCKAIGSDVIPNLPDNRVPTVLIYKDEKCQKQLLGMSLWGNEAVSPDVVEWVLYKRCKVLASAKCEEDPLGKSREKARRNGKIFYRNEYAESDQSDRSDTSESGNESENDTRGYSSLAMEASLRLK